MKKSKAISQIKSVFTDIKLAEQSHNKTDAVLFNDRYFTLREFCMNCDILTFTELEEMEKECLTRLQKLEDQHNKQIGK